VHLFGIDWVGVKAENGRKLLLSVIFVGVVLLSSAILRALVGLVLGRRARQASRRGSGHARA
jgi:hypothetical protein